MFSGLRSRCTTPIWCARLSEETLAVRGVARQVLAEDLERAEPLDHHVVRKVDAGHPARPEPPDEAIARGDGASEIRVEGAFQLAAVVGAVRRVVRVESGALRTELHRGRAYQGLTGMADA